MFNAELLLDVFNAELLFNVFNAELLLMCLMLSCC